MEKPKCLHECVIVETTEKVAQYYYTQGIHLIGRTPFSPLVRWRERVECIDCGENVTDQFRKQVEGELGLPK